MSETSISKDAAVELLQKAGYESYLEDGIVFVKWNDDPNLPDTIADFLRSNGYLASYGIKGRGKSGSPALTISDMEEIDDNVLAGDNALRDNADEELNNLFKVS